MKNIFRKPKKPVEPAALTRLLDQPTGTFADVIARVTASVGVITSDEKLVETFNAYLKQRGTKNTAAAYRALLDFLPQLLVTHAHEVIDIVAAMTGKTTQEVAEQPRRETIADIRSFLDADLISFFVSSVNTARTVSKK